MKKSIVPVLTFHAVDDSPDVIAFPPRLFERLLAALHGAGYKSVALPHLAECLNRRVRLPEAAVAITFDDGYRSVYDHAFPVLQRYGFSATVFLAVGRDGGRSDSDRLPSMCGRSMLNWREIREMHGSGVEFGGHTLSHPDLTRLSAPLVETEIVEGKNVIENSLGAAVTTFAYPFGRYDDRSREVVRHRFACACSDRLGLVRPESDVYTMERVDAYYLRSDKLTSSITTPLFPLYVRARAVPRQIRRSLGL